MCNEDCILSQTLLVLVNKEAANKLPHCENLISIIGTNYPDEVQIMDDSECLYIKVIHTRRNDELADQVEELLDSLILDLNETDLCVFNLWESPDELEDGRVIVITRTLSYGKYTTRSAHFDMWKTGKNIYLKTI